MKRFILILVSLLLSLGTAASSFADNSGGGGGGSSASSQGSQVRTPTAVDVYNQGYSAWNAGKYKEAAQYFANAISMKSDYAEAYNMLGFCTRKLGDITKAIGYYEKALKLKPNFPEAREYFGEAWLQQGNLAKAVQQYIILEKAGTKNAKELLEKISDYVNAM